MVLPVFKKVKVSSGIVTKYFCWFVPPSSVSQSLLLFVIRSYWGWEFFLTGKGKLMDLEKPTTFFQSLGIPFPHAQAILAGATECFGGLLLLAGLCSRLISIPLTILLTVAYLTADLDRVKMIFSDPDKFLTADEFLFLFAVVIVFVFGPGKFSIDWLIKRKASPSLGRA
jgi:putative oxidoreductase